MEQEIKYSRLAESELANLGIVLSSLRSLRGNRRSHIAYVGMPVTTGKRLYQVFSNEGVKDREALSKKLGPQAFWNLVVQPNIQEGTVLADKLGSERDLLFVAPSVFDASKWQWTQTAYMALWYNVITEFAGSHFVMDGWEYSLGGLREVFFSMMLQWRYIRWYNKDQAARIFGLQNLFAGLDHQGTQKLLEEMWQMRVYDSAGKEISVDRALSLSVDAIYDLRERGFEYQELIGVAYSLMQLPVLSPLCDDGPTPWETDVYSQAREKLLLLI
jgi:hypothetical protein